MTPRTKKALVAIIVTAVAAVAIISLSTPPSNAQTVTLNNLPGTLLEGHSYSFYVTVTPTNVAKIYPNSIITLNVYKSTSTLVDTGSFNGSGVITVTGGFLVQVVVYSGNPTNQYGYGGSPYISYKVTVDFPSGGTVQAGQYSLAASLLVNASSTPVSSSPDVFSLTTSPNTFPIVPIFIAADLVVIGVVVWVIMTMRRRR